MRDSLQLFESVLLLMVLAVALLQVSRRFALPYPSLLALAGIGIPLLPHFPTLLLEPGLALAVFVTPSLFNAAYDTAPRELQRQWLPLTMMAVAAVVVSTVAVAMVGHWWAHLGWAAAITLGAIVSPPDASAVSAVLNRFSLPRRTLLILEGESLLNDATALLLFGMAEAIAMPGVRSQLGTLGSLIFAIPGGALLGYVLGRLFLRVARWTAGSLSASIAEISITFGTWILGERLHVSPILAVVVLAMTIAKSAPRQQPPRDRVHSEALWGSLTFILGTLAFLLVGEQVLTIARSLSDVSLRSAIAFGALVFVTCVVVRIAWVFFYRVSAKRVLREMDQPLPSAKMGFLTSWCGIRGMVTIATAAALPPTFPGRSLIVFASFSVVLGTLVVQGFTIGPLIKFLDMREDDTLKQEMEDIRSYLFRTGLSSLAGRKDPAAVNIRRELASALKEVGTLDFSAQSSGIHKLRRKVLAEQRKSLITMRDRGDLQEDVFRMLEEELDWAVLASSPAHDLTLEEV